MIKRIILWTFLLILIVGNGYTSTFVWDHDCINTTGFKVYYGDTQGQESFLIANVLCPNIAVTLDNLPEKYYVVKAYNSNGESTPSNEVVLAAYYYNSIKYQYGTDGRILYKGEHTQQDASEGDINWVITKYYYSAGNLVQVRIRITSWTNRAIGW